MVAIGVVPRGANACIAARNVEGAGHGCLRLPTLRIKDAAEDEQRENGDAAHYFGALVSGVISRM
jgi:hypothetical protein